MATTTTSPPSSSPSPNPNTNSTQNVPSTTHLTEQDYNTQIDSLLTRYLFLLNEYTTLRSSLSSLQAGMYQNLARANFAAERGMRYGKEYFDERMAASRRVRVLPREARDGERIGEEGKGIKEGEQDKEKKEEEKVVGEEKEKVMEWRVVKVDLDEEGNEVVVKEEEKDVDGKKDGKREEAAQKADSKSEAQEQDQHKHEDTKNPTDPTDRHQKEDTNQEPEKKNGDQDADNNNNDDDKKARIKKIHNDPLRWFGLLTPLPLRQAQSQAIQAVEQIIPRLVTVNAEMARVEIEVRRARKRREKAAAGKAKAGKA